MSEHALPAAQPLDCPDLLLEWQPRCLSLLCKASVPLPDAKDRQGRTGPRLLACHDMAGGYGEDRLVQGGTDADFYRLRRWACLDSFVYFSHRLVTIPPPGWINAAHTHGVRVLGTLITEWEAGAAACRQLFGSQAAAEAAAERLAAIAAFHGFEGWLVNIENPVDVQHLPHLLHFLRVLTARMRQVVPGWSQVIWYDAVTTEGKLEWQNTVNNLNRPFFDACDALWVNYTWKEGTPAAVRQEAGDRAADVYMGVDCFGRGTYGGGGFNCHEALLPCIEQGLSAALFATAWPYEGDCGPAAPSCWLQRDALFWRGIEGCWRGACQGSSSSAGGAGSGDGGSRGASVVTFARNRGRRNGPRLPLPLYSNFSSGSGRAVFQAGRQLSAQPWFNLSLQTLQPLLVVEAEPEDDAAAAGPGSGQGDGASCSDAGDAGSIQEQCPVQASISDARAYSGGSSLLVSGALRPGQRAVVRLFEPAAAVPRGGAWVGLTASVAGSVEVRVVLHLAGSAAGDTQEACIELSLLTNSPEELPAAAAPAAAVGPPGSGMGGGCPLLSLAVAPCSIVPCGAPAADGGGGTAAQPAVQPHDWQTFEYFIGPEVLAAAGAAAKLVEVDVVVVGAAAAGGATDPCPFETYLGELCIDEARPAPPKSVQGLRCEAVQLSSAEPGADCSSKLEARLEWQGLTSGARCCHVWCVFESSEPQWLGGACADGYWIADLPVPPVATAVTFVVQAEGRNGQAEDLAAAARVAVSLPQLPQ